eukprot:gene15577-21675_t
MSVRLRAAKRDKEQRAVLSELFVSATALRPHQPGQGEAATREVKKQKSTRQLMSHVSVRKRVRGGHIGKLMLMAAERKEGLYDPDEPERVRGGHIGKLMLMAAERKEGLYNPDVPEVSVGADDPCVCSEEGAGRPHRQAYADGG